MASATVKRKLTFVAWADAIKAKPFDLDAAGTALTAIPAVDRVLAHGDQLTAVDHAVAGTQAKPVQLRLLALHDADNAPSEWDPSGGARRITIGAGSYTAFFTHVVIWPDNVAAFDVHANAPGLGRLAEYIKEHTGQRVLFRALYEQGLKEQLEDLAGYRGFEYGVHDPHKKAQLGSSGMVGSILPKVWQKIPSMRVKVGMGRRGRRDAYLAPDVVDDVIAITDSAEQFFDSLILRGPSKTQKTPKGRPRTIEVNLLSQRLRVEESIKREADGGNLPDRAAIFAAMEKARGQFDQAGKIQAAQEARIVLDQSA